MHRDKIGFWLVEQEREDREEERGKKYDRDLEKYYIPVNLYFIIKWIYYSLE